MSEGPGSSALGEGGAPPRPVIHLVNPLAGIGGSELRAAGLYRELREQAEVHLWSERTPAAAFDALPIRRLDAENGSFPRGGTLVFVGVYYFPLGSWISRVAVDRVIIIYNTFSAINLAGLCQQLAALGLPRPEMVYASALVQQSIERPEVLGLPASRSEFYDACARVRGCIAPGGVIHPSAIDVESFAAARRAASLRPERPLVVGRLSRDTHLKFHPDDPALFRFLGERGVVVRLMGATCIADRLRDAPGVEVLPAGAEASAAFLASLDVFLYRVSPTGWLEASGRVIVEAMACGLAVVGERRGGYVEQIEHGQNGFLFQTDHEALEIIGGLQQDPALRHRIGQAAQRTVFDLYSTERRRAYAAFYLSPST